MRRLSAALIVAVSAVAFTQMAAAADLPRKAPAYTPPPPPLAYNWTGFYVGGNVGYSWGRARNDLELAPFSLPWTDKLDGWLGGGQAGYNWQFGKLVFGLEADLQATGQKAKRSGGQSGTASATVDVSYLGQTIPVTFASPYSYSYLYGEKLPWFGTVRGRNHCGTDNPDIEIQEQDYRPNIPCRIEL
jgi:outer membrane immunogenic protein